jgi:hypothetical protein
VSSWSVRFARSRSRTKEEKKRILSSQSSEVSQVWCLATVALQDIEKIRPSLHAL